MLQEIFVFSDGLQILLVILSQLINILFSLKSSEKS